MKHLYNRESRKDLKNKMVHSQVIRRTFSFYKYGYIPDPQEFRDKLYALFHSQGMLGRIYVAKEGINGQVSIPSSHLNSFILKTEEIPLLNGIRLNYAIQDGGKSFFALIIKVKEKIVADGLDDESFDVLQRGIHLKAEEFNELADQENTIVVDMRNHYESEVGHFENAICPDVETFREALPVVEQILKPHKEKNIIMYCTGGIRCEKASAYYKHRGFKNVYQLDGGIIEYARQVNSKGLKNKFVGKNFVFDERLGERISQDIISHCHQCGKLSDTHINCANDACHILFIQCSECQEKYTSCCSLKCKEFNALDESEKNIWKSKIQFNGTKNVKGRLDLNSIDRHLDLAGETNST